ncbi:exodeoxyribonuclease VII large subunit [Tunturiibacter empetritectus]|uniref:Exodeoxyribonuclease 7 large subunit n=1 Tax=Tunturiibacter lichenicola TaxID=2051959 RepID=A0A852VHA4_9BACT|nr:exodeoxyribonuclease VII large subunit [Edaphobacter lichenicola]NYF88876.1 exodeoxyribonuclease VII large subunit [Edaphobacter lichenicola]
MSEREDNPPTLASLRARRGKVRTERRSSSKASTIPVPDTLFQSELFSLYEEDSALAVASVEPVSGSEESGKIAIEPARRRISGVSEPAMERHIWSVRALVMNARQQIETTYSDLWVEGEISNCRPAPSGHIYFTLKDGEAQLPVVLFRRQAGLLRFRPADGLAVLVRGRVSVYESRGQLQLIGETMEPRGAGALQLAFEQLKARLLSEGLFDAARKRQLPSFPKCIGIVTSLSGAVIRDIVTVVRRRHARLNLLIYPATMQGASSPESVVGGIRWFNANSSLVDAIVIARGGGSMEDLAGFNDEALARAIAASALPVVSAIGHETDFTIADFVADLRAPTPSAAAELITSAQHRIEDQVAALGARVLRAGRFHLMHARQRYARLSAEAVLNRLRDAVSRRDQRLDELRFRLDAAVQQRLRVPAQRLNVVSDRLRRQDISVRIAATGNHLLADTLRLQRVAMESIVGRRTRLERASTRLDVLSPLAVLSRGYALVYLQSGAGDSTLLRSSADATPGQTIRARLAHGTLKAKITQTDTDEVPETGKL